MLIDLAWYLIALAIYVYHKYRAYSMRHVDVKHTDLAHVALAVVAANSLTVSPYGALASVMLTALYVIYQWWQDKSPKDIAVYTGTFAAVIATKFGISLTVL
jgi:TRAP-type uncharacterized transport system fused permease subunit